MARSPSTKRKNLSKTTSTSTSGGCFSLFSIPVFYVFIFIGIILILSGETTFGDDNAYRNNILQGDGISHIFTPEVQFWENDILRWSNEWGLDPNFVATVMQIESCGSPFVESHAGAVGLFQVMPFHFNTTDNPYAPETNAARGLAYLRAALDQYQNPRLGFAGYNGGITNAGKPEWEWPSEMIRYTYWGFNIYSDAISGKNTSPTLKEWLGSGGTTLCAEARVHLGLSQ